MLKPFTTFIRDALRATNQPPATPSRFLQKFDVELTENMRALRLILSISEQLLGRGLAASDVVYYALGIAKTYCSRKVHIDISYTILTLSLDRGTDREPLTLVHSVALKGQDYQTIQYLEELAVDIKENGVELEEAERRLDEILSAPRPHPRWVSHFSAGCLSGGVLILYSSNPFLWFVGFMMGVIISVMMYRLTKAGLSAFYLQALAGLIITVIAASVALLSRSEVLPIVGAMNPNLLIVSGIVLLVAGMMIVSAFQDAIDEYYVTAGARILKVVLMTAGIVLGVTIGLYIAGEFGVYLDPTTERLSFSTVTYQYIGAALLAGAFALGNQAKLVGIIGSAAVGFLSLYTVLAFTAADVGVIAASGISAALVGFSATLLQRLFRIPTMVTISAGIIPLVPGLTLFSALTHISQSAVDTADFDTGIALLLRAIIIAAVIAAGASFGNLLGRSQRRRIIHAQNRLPWRQLSSPKSKK